MKAFRFILANILLIQFSLAQYSFAGGKGPGSTGGGDPVSQEVRAIIRALPSVLRSKGLQYFPEIDMVAFEKLTNSEILIELKEDIVIKGAPKAAQFDRSQNLIQVSPREWHKISISTNPEITKRAIVFHEVLGLFGLEKNDDYSISNRLVGLEYLSMVGIKGSKNQIVPRNHQDPQVIYWKINPDSTVTFFHCPDRNMVSSCRMMGARSYTQKELAQVYKNLYASIQKAEKSLNTSVNIVKGYWVLVAIAVIVVPLALGMSWFMAPIVAGVFVGVIPSSAAEGKSKRLYSLKYQANKTIQATLLKSGPARIENFNEIVQEVNQLLLTLDTDSNLNPELHLDTGLK